MKGWFVFWLLCPALFAAVTGTVTNRTTGKPQPGATVTLYKLGENGLESVESVKSDSRGGFTINQDLEGPRLLQSAYDGVTYNHMLPPGAPTSGVALEVYNSSTQAGEAHVAQHMVLFEPNGTELAVSESYVWENKGKTAYNDPRNGTLRFYVPKAGSKSIQVQATAPQGMPIRRAAEKTSEQDVYMVDFPIKPGESNIQINYSMPWGSSGTFEGRVLYKNGGPTSLIAPAGVEIKGDGLESRGAEPRTKSSIYQTKAASFKIDIAGTGSLRRPQEADSDQGGGGDRLQQIMPRIYGKVWWILALALSILLLGFVLLYRARLPFQAPAAPKIAATKKR